MVLFYSCQGNEDYFDPEAPSIVIQTPTNEPSFSTIDETLTFTGVANDDQKLSRVSWSLNGGSKDDAIGTEEWTVSDVSLNIGDNIFIATAEDAAENTSSDTLVITKNKYLIFLGVPKLNPLGVFIGQPANVTISVQIAYNSNLISSSVELIEIDDDNNEIATICSLYDNGSLSNGDEISGDNVFTGKNQFTLTSSKRLRVKAKTQETEGEVDGFSSVVILRAFEPITGADKAEVITTLDNSVNKLNEFAVSNDYDNAIAKTIEWLNTLAGVENAKMVDGYIDIIYSSGLSGGIIISKAEASGTMTQGGLPQNDERNKTPNIPLNKQTRGDYKALPVTKSATATNDEIILDKDVLIYEPFQSVFEPYDKGDEIKEEFEKSDFDFNIVHLINQACTIDALKNLTDYGYVYIDTHGSAGSTWFLTGQLVSASDNYDLMLKENKLKVFQNVTYAENIFESITGSLYAVSGEFIKALDGKFPNSIVFGSFCHSAETNLLSDAFISKGAKTYIGFDNTVWSDFAKTVSVEFAKGIVTDGNTTGEVFDDLSVTVDDSPPNANAEMDGSEKMHYSFSLINGDFEYGDLTGWTRDGDGRVVVKLGTQSPAQANFMGIISTGLGYTTSSGQISQSFKVSPGITKLVIKWNFLSEEFLEWVGSVYQDYLSIIIKEGTDENVVFFKNIDTFYNEYSLIDVSPGIVFDKGDVYMTGWKELTLDISAYSGKVVTLIIQAGDVGDSIYDSAVLIDEIIVE